jgi:lipopolysaccharide biosynthesis protein
MIYYLKLMVAKIMRLLGYRFAKFCTHFPKIRTVAYIAIYQNKAFTEWPKEGKILTCDHIASIELVDRNFKQNTIVQYQKRENYQGLRVALLAHWDPQKIIDPYVTYYAQHLKELGYSVILCSTNEVKDLDISNNVFDAVIYRTNKGYDFSSWYAALTVFPSLFEADEILLTNDSIFAPVGDLQPLYSAMQQLKCDFWGPIEYPLYRPHLQSFFIVLYKNVLTNKAFKTFLNNIGPSGDRLDSIQYEITLTQWLISNNLIGAARFPISVNINPYGSNHLFSSCYLRSGQFPFVKRRMVFDNPYAVFLPELPDLIKSSGYPVDFILNYAKRRSPLPLQARRRK